VAAAAGIDQGRKNLVPGITFDRAVMAEEAQCAVPEQGTVNNESYEELHTSVLAGISTASKLGALDQLGIADCNQPTSKLPTKSAGPACVTKAARWAARAAERQKEISQGFPAREVHASQAATELQPHSAAHVGGSDKAARWAARASQAQAMPAQTPAQAPQPSSEMQTKAAGPAGVSKAARWAARAAASPAPASPGAAAPQNKILGCFQLGHQVRMEWPAPHKPAPGSAMASWMVRAEAKQLHLPWEDKFRDYADEVYLSVQVCFVCPCAHMASFSIPPFLNMIASTCHADYT
jgi:hypothetical protein